MNKVFCDHYNSENFEDFLFSDETEEKCGNEN